mmetsp:Transcript_147832/g.256594  ORF Transcript_147832/g.256594 Transcript_147832/m.256594 type:complete len:111 (-) Transcript_147832:822-1154(-)
MHRPRGKNPSTGTYFSSYRLTKHDPMYQASAAKLQTHAQSIFYMPSGEHQPCLCFKQKKSRTPDAPHNIFRTCTSIAQMAMTAESEALSGVPSTSAVCAPSTGSPEMLSD